MSNVLKRIASILLLAVLLFNWVGYRILSDYFQQRSDVAFEAKLDKRDYDESQLIELKVPLNLPYQTNWNDFERFDGEIEVEGVHYKYVKRKVYNDSLILLCLPNEAKTKIKSAGEEFFRLVNDLQYPSQGKKSDNGKPSSTKNPVTEYFSHNNAWHIPELTALHFQFYIDQSSYHSRGFVITTEQPPEA